MVRTYKKKLNGPKWTLENIENAKVDIEKGMSVNKAAKTNGILEPTLRRYLKSTKPRKKGKPTVLTPSEEEEIVMCCNLFAEWGFGVTKTEVINVVSEFCQQNRRHNPFKNNIPGPDWWAGFCRRHPELVKRKAQPLQMVRAKCATIEAIDHWFDSCLYPTLTALNLLDKPDSIYNVDESGFPISGRPTYVLARRGSKSVHLVIGGSGRDNITIQTCITGTGKLLPPYVIYAGKYLYDEYTHGGSLGSRYTVTGIRDVDDRSVHSLSP